MKLRDFVRWGKGLGSALALVLVPLDAPAARDGVEIAAVPQVGSYLAGRFAQHVDDWQAAAKFMNDALAHDPDDLGLLRRAFLLELSDGRIAEALPLAKRLEAREKGSSAATLLLVADDGAGGRFDEAAVRLGTLVPEGVAKYAGPLLGGWLAYGRGQGKAAVEAALAPLNAIQGLAVLAALHTALIADAGGDTATAAQSYNDALQGGTPTLRVVQAVGSFLARTGHVDQARALYATYAKDLGDTNLLDPAALGEEADIGTTLAVATAQDGMAESLFDLASALHQESSDELAMMYARLAQVLRPRFPLNQLLIGDILASRGHHEEALALYREIVDNRALGWTARLRSADSLAQLEHVDEAAALLEAMAVEHPDRADPLVHLAELRRATKHYADAISAFDRALQRVAKLEERHWPLIYGRATCYERVGPWEKAEKDLLAALDISKDQAIVLNFLGYSWADKGVNLPRARTMIERAVALRPKDGYIIDSLGWVLFRQGDLKSAVTQLERAIELKPADAAINDHLGDAYWAIGRQPEAIFQWRRALLNSDEDDLTVSLTRKLRERDPGNPLVKSPSPGAL